MKKSALIVLLFITAASASGQNGKKANNNLGVAKNKVVLVDTAFRNLGVKLGYPKGFLISAIEKKDENRRMSFYNKDSSIFITVFTTSGLGMEDIIKGWDEESSKVMDDGWLRHISKVPEKHYDHAKPVYVSTYLFPLTMGGARYILIEMITTKPGSGIAEFEAVKASVKKRPAPLVQRDIVPGEFSMGVPAYLEPTNDPNGRGYASKFRDENTWLLVDKMSGSEMMSLMNMQKQKEIDVNMGFTLKGSINYYSPSGVNCAGYYGIEKPERNATGVVDDYKFEALVFFNKPNSTKTDCWVICLKLNHGMPQDLAADMKELLSTIKSK